jgi:hypothetical protein
MGCCCLDVALIGRGYTNLSKWIPAKDVSRAVEVLLENDGSHNHEGEENIADTLWALLDQVEKHSRRQDVAEHYVFDVLWLADLQSFSKGRTWIHCSGPLLVASEQLGATVRTVCVQGAGEEDCLKARTWTDGLRGKLILLQDDDFEAPGALGSSRLTARAEAMVFDMMTRWRGHLLLPVKNGSGVLDQSGCRIRLDALAPCGGAEACACCPCAVPALNSDVVHCGKSSRKNAETTLSRAESNVQGLVSRFSYLRVLKVVDAASIPTHLFGGGSYSLRPESARSNGIESSLRTAMGLRRAAMIACLETWQDKKRSAEDLLNESAAERKARVQQCQVHALQQCAPQVPTQNAAGGGYLKVSSQLVVIQCDAGGADRLLVSPLRCEKTTARVSNGLRSYAPHLCSWFFAPDGRERQRLASARTMSPLMAKPVAMLAGEDTLPRDLLATVPKERQGWCARIPHISKRLRIEFGSQALPLSEDAAAYTDEAVLGSCSAVCLPTLAGLGGAPEKTVLQTKVWSMRECLTAMAEREIEAIKAADQVLSGTTEEKGEKQLPKTTNKFNASTTSKSNSATSLAESKNKKLNKAKDFVNKVRAALGELGQGCTNGGGAASSPSSFSENGNPVLWHEVHALSGSLIKQGYADLWPHGVDEFIAPQEDAPATDALQRVAAAVAVPAATDEVRAWRLDIQGELEWSTKKRALTHSYARAHMDSCSLLNAGEIINVGCTHGPICRMGTCSLEDNLEEPGSWCMYDGRIFPSPKKPRHTTKNDPQRPSAHSAGQGAAASSYGGRRFNSTMTQDGEKVLSKKKMSPTKKSDGAGQPEQAQAKRRIGDMHHTVEHTTSSAAARKANNRHTPCRTAKHAGKQASGSGGARGSKDTACTAGQELLPQVVKAVVKEEFPDENGAEHPEYRTTYKAVFALAENIATRRIPADSLRPMVREYLATVRILQGKVAAVHAAAATSSASEETPANSVACAAAGSCASVGVEASVATSV